MPAPSLYVGCKITSHSHQLQPVVEPQFMHL
jgi:hypothetical protein